MTKPGRNRPCPCGSGKKYKLCCLPADEAARRPKPPPAPRSGPADLADDDDFEQLESRSNHVVELIHSGRLDEAEDAANELLRRYPDVMDGHLRLAMVYEARRDTKLAAEHYRKAAATLDDHCDALRRDLLRQADALVPSPE